MKKQKFYIETLGCKVNQYESDGIASCLEEKGFVRGTKGKSVDVCIINTCAVTSKAGMQSRQAIRKIIRDNPGAKIIVTGCHAQTDPDLIKKIEHIDQIVCHKDKTLIADLVSDQASDPATAFSQTSFVFQPPDHSKSNQFRSFNKPVQGDMTRAYLKIQDGCNAFCTYCIVPYARGSSVSMPESEVFKHLEGLSNSGFKEVIITGIHTGMYGLDLDPPSSLLDLLKKIDKKKVLERIRISSIEPKEMSEDLMNLAGQGHILCDHFHIPLQSGDDEILKRMKRPYSAAFFEEMVHKLHEKLPFAGIGVDTLIGFPSETESQFENTFNLIKRLPISYLHIFPFSARKGTPAYHFADKIDPEVIRERCMRMRDLDKEKRFAFIQANRGRKLQGLVQKTCDKKTGFLTAVTANYLTVQLEKNDSLKGKLVDLIYEQCDSDMNLIGQVIE
ncbi:MAG: tRNA (N(6)-L-threonylcarbamoyladenosine(37)-C(2))-methylthiotransferase MtaB [Proteobacteria bacterium]|nr:tRNA (N(6)-L-threonylcarbamoyladenosine(37)-C(2))-methylthiotransferase MtaB [Desulfobacula sp.]MBU3954772.1 tRNA (N(6)-L-threonylcarbamoyladenosine(37)-C(2))-methylthiotransferase MtaB [Pseudomonadota bacterium]MBU4132738.1 tRNA (N(6)-L-threonylcarbamoyladenosine(37)-C(2))-methylthiotransferase MtaB [Pseudomonadota bacterium]